MSCSPQVFDAVVQYVAVDVINKIHGGIAVHCPNYAMNSVQFVHVFDASVAIAVHCTSRSPKLTTPSALLPEKLSIPVFEQDIGFLARQVVVARVGLIRHRC
jgi:hypothetical protein